MHRVANMHVLTLVNNSVAMPCHDNLLLYKVNNTEFDVLWENFLLKSIFV